MTPEQVTHEMRKAYADAIRKAGSVCALNEAIAAAINAMPPIPMILHCPACGLQHIDAPETHRVVIEGGVHVDDVETWENPPHRSHLCHGCGHIWRPADVCTVGVERIETKGRNDSPAINASGCVLVPREPTEAMIEAYGETPYCPPVNNCYKQDACNVWSAMLAAAESPAAASSEREADHA